MPKGPGCNTLPHALSPLQHASSSTKLRSIDCLSKDGLAENSKTRTERIVNRKPSKMLCKLKAVKDISGSVAHDMEVNARKRASSCPHRHTNEPSKCNTAKHVKPLVNPEQAQDSAFEDLVKSIDTLGPVEEIVAFLTKDVILCNGELAFPQPISKQAIQVLQCETARSLAVAVSRDFGDAETTVASIRMALGVLAPRYNLSVSNVVGQILWRHHKSEVLKDKRHRKAVEDFSWAVAGNTDNASQLIEAVEKTFQSFTADRNGLLSCREWQNVVRLIRKDPTLSAKIKMTEADRVFYHHTHRDGEVHYDVGFRHFKLMLLTLADEMGVHPHRILLSITSGADDVASTHANPTCDGADVQIDEGAKCQLLD